MTEQKKSLAQLFAACWKDKVLTASPSTFAISCGSLTEATVP